MPLVEEYGAQPPIELLRWRNIRGSLLCTWPASIGLWLHRSEFPVTCVPQPCMQQNVLSIKYYFGQHQDRRGCTVYDSVEPDQSTAASSITLQAVPRSTGLLWSQEARVEGPMFSVNVPAIQVSTGYSLVIRETSFQCVSISHCYLQRSLMVVAGEPLFLDPVVVVRYVRVRSGGFSSKDFFFFLKIFKDFYVNLPLSSSFVCLFVFVFFWKL